MRYQERIYIQNDNRGVRNKDILNVNMSSDICIFKSPTFGVSGATTLPCGSIDCDLSGVSLSNIFSAVTATCYTSATSVCHSATTWETKFYVDSELALTKMFYSASTYGSIPTDSQFLNSVTVGLLDLGFSFIKNGTVYTIDKPYGGKSFEIDVCVSIYTLTGTTGYSCPIGYSATPANDACQQINITGATFNGSSPTIVAGNQDTAYINYGAYFYPSIQDNPNLPVYYVGNFSDLKDQAGNTINPLNIVSTGNAFWSNDNITTTDGRLNNIGLSASTTEWLGFSKCINILSAGTYYVGVAADNDARVKVNGTLVINFSGSQSDNFKKWSVFPFYFNSGLNIIEMEGLNDSAATSFGAEIYNPVNYTTLTAATTTGETGLIFSTVEFIGKNWQLGETFGYTCPDGYALDTCSDPFTCTQILTTGITASSGCTTMDCLDNCVIVCNHDFPYVDNESQGVYLLNDSTSSIPLTFNFTGNTSTFLDGNVSFKYEIYRYLSNSKVFKIPAVYKSELFSYSTFSATSALTVSVPTANLNLDGEYIIKGYFETEACTDFLRRLGRKIDTSIYKTGNIYGLYVPETDAYFLAVREAETPVFNGTGSEEATYSPVTLYQQVIEVDFSKEGNIPPESDEGEPYERTGSTFALTSEYIGDVLLTLNGLTLAKDIDYTLSGQVLTFLGPISDGDIITIFYTRTNVNTLISNNVLVDTVIPSGATDTQGSSKYFYNTTSGKYEVYTDNQPLVGTRIMVMLNGVTLAEGIDYYQSTSNLSRIILSGILMVGDIITLIYYPAAIIIDGITQNNTVIGWNILNGPTLQNGEFSLEYSLYPDFSTYTVSDIVPYQINVTDYNGILTLTGDVGTKLYYRVKNTKNYMSICGDPIESIAYSETVPVVIQSNAINSY